MNDLGDALSWPTRDPEWITKIVVMSLITIIPIVGSIVLVGWMLVCLDNVRDGRRVLPPIGFGYIGRGFPLFLVSLVYALAVGVAAAVVVVAFLALAAAAGGTSTGAGAALASLGVVAAAVIALAGVLGIAYLTPAIILETDRSGIGGGLDFNRVLALGREHPQATLLAALSLLIAYFIGSIGSFVCGVGVYLTIAYGYAAAAGVVRRYEIELAPPGAPATH